MKNKVALRFLLGCTVLLLCASVSSAQVFSGNVVGYVTFQFKQGYNYLCNPLDNGSGNLLSALMQHLPHGTKVSTWNVASQSFDAPSTYSTNNEAWDTNRSLPVGRGLMLQAPVDSTVTFVGEVLQGTLVNPIAGGNKYSLVGSMVPMADTLQGLGFPASAGDVVFIPETSGQIFKHAYTWWDGVGWHDPDGSAGAAGPTNPVAAAFFVSHAGADTNWVRNFTVSLTAKRAWPGGKAPQITRMTVEKGQVTLAISNPDNVAFNVQVSTDRSTWATAARQAGGTSWSAAAASAQAFYQLTPP